MALDAPLSAALGITRLGIHHVRLLPGRRTSYPHAESTEQEFVYVLEGKPDEGRSQADGDRRTPARRQPYSPESATSTHYFIQHARNFAPDDGAITQFMHEQLRRAFQGRH